MKKNTTNPLNLLRWLTAAGSILLACAALSAADANSQNGSGDGGSTVIVSGATGDGADFIWQENHATVLPQGDLQWAPRPFVYEAGEVVRYIDYDNGDDASDGASTSTAWKHHP